MTKHTSLDNVNADIINAGINLLHEKRRWGVVDVLHTQCVLRR